MTAVDRPAHSEFGPSRLARILICHASVKATRGVPDMGSEASATGTKTHDLLELCIKSNHRPADFSTEGEWAIYTPTMRAHVEAVIDYLANFPGTIFSEIDVDFDVYVPGGYGRVDVVIIDGQTVTVIDAKFGHVRVIAERSPQLMAYGVGVLLGFESLLEGVNTVRLCIAQPSIDWFDEWVTTPDELHSWARDTLAPAIADALGPNPAFTPTIEACRYCPIRGSCVARKADHFDRLASMFGEPPLAAATMTLDELADVLPRLEVFEAWAKDVRGFAFRALARGEVVPGYKIVEGRSVRQFVDKEAAAVALSEALAANGKSAAEIDAALWKRELISPADADKLIGRKSILVQTLTAKTLGRPTLAPESDKRPAIDLRATLLDAFPTIDTE